MIDRKVSDPSLSLTKSSNSSTQTDFRRPKGHVVRSQSRRYHPASAPVGKRSGYKSTSTLVLTRARVSALFAWSQ